MPVIIGGHAIIPGPQVVLKKEFQELGDGRFIGNIVGATLNGYLVATIDGYTPQAIPLNARLATIIAKQKAFRQLFVPDGQMFEVQGFDGSQPVKFNAKVKSIEFDEGSNWVEVCPYKVELEGTFIAGEDSTTPIYIDSSTESWSFEDAENPHVYRASHSMTAKGKTVYNADGTLTTLAWQNAKSFVVTKLSPGWTASTSPWSPQSGQTIWQESVDYDSTASGAYNRILQESIDELDGTYSLTESYVLSAHNYVEDLNVSVKRVTGEPLVTTVISLQGKISGLFTTLHDYASKLANAVTRWNVLRPTLSTVAQSYAPVGITLNTRPIEGTYDENFNEGSISYNYEFNDRRLTNDTFESYSISRKSTYQSPVITVVVAGTIQGVLYADDTDPTLKFTRALTQWNLVKLLLYARALTEASGLNAYPIDNEVTFDRINGSVSYSYTFDNRPNATVIDDYVVAKRYSREDGRTIITVSGTIQGLYSSITSGDLPVLNAERFDNAETYWEGIENSLLGRAATVSVVYTEVNPTPYATEVSKNAWQGTIGYSYEYNNLPSPCIMGSLSEIITVTDNPPYQIIAIQPIPGRTQGPIIQDIQSKTPGRRSVTVEFVIPVTYAMSSQVCTGTILPPTVDLSGYAPVYQESLWVQEPVISFSPSSGRGSISQSWTYV